MKTLTAVFFATLMITVQAHALPQEICRSSYGSAGQNICLDNTSGTSGSGWVAGTCTTNFYCSGDGHWVYGWCSGQTTMCVYKKDGKTTTGPGSLISDSPVKNPPSTAAILETGNNFAYRDSYNMSGGGRQTAAKAKLDACWTSGYGITDTVSSSCSGQSNCVSTCYSYCDVNANANVACFTAGSDSCYTRCSGVTW